MNWEAWGKQQAAEAALLRRLLKKANQAKSYQRARAERWKARALNKKGKK